MMNVVLEWVLVASFVVVSWLVKSFILWLICRQNDQSEQLTSSHVFTNDETESRDQEKKKEVDEIQNKKRKQLIEAMNHGDIDELTTAIEWAVIEDCGGGLADDINAARAKLKELENRGRARESFHAMQPGLISELRSYSSPPQVVYDVMTCVYLLLGMKRHQLNTWPSIQGLLCNSGKYKLRKMIEGLDSSSIPEEISSDIKKILSKYNFQSVYLASEGAAAFYMWIQEILDSMASV